MAPYFAAQAILDEGLTRQRLSGLCFAPVTRSGAKTPAKPGVVTGALIDVAFNRLPEHVGVDARLFPSLLCNLLH